MKYIIILLLFFLGSCSKHDSHLKANGHTQVENNKETSKTYYTCPMHPQIKEKKPGKCPICHMNLNKVEIETEEESTTFESQKQKVFWYCKNQPDVTSEIEAVCPIDGKPMLKKIFESKAGDIVAKVILRKAQLSHFRPDFFPVTKMKMMKKVHLLGVVQKTEEKESNIPARISGRVEKVYVKSSGISIKKNDPLIEIYSPQLITGGEEYIVARRSYQKNGGKEFKELLTQTEEKLFLWGIRKFQLDKWFKSGKVPKSITLYSPKSGIVSKRNAIQGKYFKEGQSLFDLVDYSSVWIEMDVYEHESSLIRIGQKLNLRFLALPGKELKSTVDFINPDLNPQTRTLKIRTTIGNPDGLLRPGMVADAELTVHMSGLPLVIPRSAIIDTGKRKVVWIKTGKKTFKAKMVKTGFESQGYVQIKEGLIEGEEVVIEGNFLLDAQAQLFGGYEISGKKAEASHSHQH